MSQLESQEGSALGGDPVEMTDASDAAIGPTHDVVEAPDDPEGQDEPELAETLYPDDPQDDADDSDPNDEDSDPNVNDEGDEDTDSEDEPDEPAIKPPHSWKAEEKERWESLPRETQEYLSEREAERERFVNSKAQEAAQVKDQITRQAETELAQFSEQQALQYQMLAQQVLGIEPPDRRLLYTGNPQDQLAYQQQRDKYEQGQIQQQQLQSAAQEHAQRAQRIRDDQEKLANQQEAERLRTEMPEWFDEASHADLERNLTAIAKDLGYPDELLPEANSSDLLALKKAHSWKEKADKWDAYQKAKMKPVREAKKRPPIPNKPGNTSGGNGEAKSAAELLYPDDVRK